MLLSFALRFSWFFFFFSFHCSFEFFCQSKRKAEHRATAQGCPHRTGAAQRQLLHHGEFGRVVEETVHTVCEVTVPLMLRKRTKSKWRPHLGKALA